MRLSESRLTDPARIPVAIAVALRGGRVLVSRRPEGGFLPGVWEFPGGKVESDESFADAARRELREETGLDGGEIEPLVVVSHDYGDRFVVLHAYLVREPEGEIGAPSGRSWIWMEPAGLESLEVPAANLPVLRALASRVR